MSDSVRADAHGVMLAAFHGPQVPAWLAGAFEDGLAGICLYGDNLSEDGDVRPAARAVAALDPTRILALDEEGGDVTRLHMPGGSPHPGNAALGVVDDVELSRTVAAGIGAELREAGVWLDLAPCADANSNSANPVIGTRSFGADPTLVARHVAAYVEGLASVGVAASVKHFPGHGDTSADSHLELPRVDASAEVLRERELVPFRAAIEAQAASIMTSHVVLSAFDPDRPATLSPAVLTGLLREELGYDGVIVSDALDMAGASGTLGLGGAAVASLAAGADLLCLGPEPSDQPSALTEAVEAVVAAVEAGSL
ncbi:glycoside hydrolase family 3 N-terminal domain-containing protein, partial [Aeromicrobium sp.]|uniref:glycoside hydrolase family 3 N-terminal domain-containing protein n=1 Tax=Aeromicrobium sp. TaxID=1871063 RepID=UPI0028AFBFD3